MNAANSLHPKCAVHFFPLLLEGKGSLFSGIAAGFVETCEKASFRDGFAASFIVVIDAAVSGP